MKGIRTGFFLLIVGMFLLLGLPDQVYRTAIAPTPQNLGALLGTLGGFVLFLLSKNPVDG
jgi:hypothetical protein